MTQFNNTGNLRIVYNCKVHGNLFSTQVYESKKSFSCKTCRREKQSIKRRDGYAKHLSKKSLIQETRHDL